VGHVCLAPFEQDFYRARVDRYDQYDDTVDVFFIDYGNTEVKMLLTFFLSYSRGRISESVVFLLNFSSQV
jgi:Tudor domain